MPINIYERRKALGLTLEYVGKRVGVSKSTVKKWESGYIKNMRRDKVTALARTLEVSPLELLSEISQGSSSKRSCRTVSANASALASFGAFVSNAFKLGTVQNSVVFYSGDSFTLLHLSEASEKELLQLAKTL